LSFALAGQEGKCYLKAVPAGLCILAQPCRQAGMGAGACSWSALQCRPFQKAAGRVEGTALQTAYPLHGTGTAAL